MGYADYEDLKSIDEVIRQVRAGGTSGWIWDGDHIRDDIFVCDIFPILEDLKYSEIDMDEDTFDYIMLEGDGDNTYNWSANISNDIDIRYVKGKEYLGAILMVHLAGDVRGNYSSYFAIENISALYECDAAYQYKAITDKYTADMSALSEGFEVYDTDTGDEIGTCYDMELSDVLDWISENTEE